MKLPRLSTVVPALVAYGPLVLTQPGWVGADTKTYLYLDPAKLLADAPWSWDSQIGMGTVTHQNIGYLFPMGPFYLLADLLHLPDWLAQRLWLGTLMFLAALGVGFLLRTIGYRGSEGGRTVAALAYMLSPYLLDYSARISVILMPWVALPWLIALTARSLRRPGLRDPALFALVVVAVGGINATALLMIAVAPLLWVVHAVAIEREVRFRRALATVAAIGALTLVTSLWWIGGLWAEGKYGLPVIRYTETYRAVAGSSNAPEVLRGLGYWFFYGNDKLGPWVEPSDYFTTNLPLLALSYGLPTLGLLAAACTRWRHRGYFLLLLCFGALIAVAGHPWESPSFLGGLFKEFTRTNAGLSLRSTPRAVPLVALATAVFLGTGASALARQLPRARTVPALLAGALVLANMPTLWLGQMVAKNLRRPEQIPAYWTQAATWLDTRDHATRVNEMPGIEFAAYRWGDTVDPITPGLMTRPYVARELFQWGSPQSASLLNALDRRVQEGVAEPASLAPILRLLAVGDVVHRNDLQYERFRTARPKQVWDLLRRAPGLGPPTAFTPVTPNVAGPEVRLIDEVELGQRADLPDAPAVSVFPVLDARSIVRSQPAGRPLVVSGDAEGLVDAATVGLLEATPNGPPADRAVFFSASFATDRPGLDRVLSDGADLLVTDSNRKRAQRWGALRENTGYTERAGETPRVYDPSDQRLEPFPGATDDHATVSEQHGNATVTATSYGNPITYTPDDRPTNALDGDPQTAWRVGAIDNPVGERLIIDLREAVTADHITVTQPLNNIRNRWITAVRLHFDAGAPVDATLGLGSRSEPGQRIDFSNRTFRHVEVEIVADDIGKRARYDGFSGVGFSEVVIPGVHVQEVIRPPVDLLAAVGPASAAHRLGFLFDRIRSNPAEPVRTDEEPRMVRAVGLPTARTFRVAGTARLSAWADNPVIDQLLGLPDALHGGVTASTSASLPSSLDQRSMSAIDGDPTTAWSSIYDKQEGFWLKYDLPAPITFSHLDLRIVNDGQHSVPTRLRLEADGQAPVLVDLPPIADGTGRGSVAAVPVDIVPVTARSLRIVVDAVREVKVEDWYTGSKIATPVAIAELGIPGLSGRTPGATFDTGCRDDLLAVDGAPIPVRVSGSTEDALDRRGLTVAGCGDRPLALDAGDHVLTTVAGRETGLDLDRVWLDSAAPASTPSAAAPPAARVLDEGRTSARVEIAPARSPYWLTLAQSFSPGWHAVTSTGVDLGPPAVIDGYANGWRIDPATLGDGPVTVTLEWTPQRVIWWGVGLSVIGVLVCLVLIALAPSRALAPPAPRDDDPGWAWPRDRGPALSGRTAAAFAATAGAFAALNLPGGLLRLPLAAAIAVLAWAVARTGRGRGVAVAIGALSLALAAGYTVLQQWRRSYPADFVWPQLFSRVHVLGVLTILLAGVEGLREWWLLRLSAPSRLPSSPPAPPGQASPHRSDEKDDE